MRRSLLCSGARLLAVLYLLLLVRDAVPIHGERLASGARAVRSALAGHWGRDLSACREQHPRDPILCERARAFASTVEWIRSSFPPGQRPLIHARETLERLELRYHARAPWLVRREQRCVVHFGGRSDAFPAVLEPARSVRTPSGALLELPAVAWNSDSAPDLGAAVAACLALPQGTVSGPEAPLAAAAVRERCRFSAAPRADSISRSGLEGIEAQAVRAGRDVQVEARFVAAGTWLDATLVALLAPDGRELDSVLQLDLGSAASHVSALLEVPAGLDAAPLDLCACLVDSEGFARMARVAVTDAAP